MVGLVGLFASAAFHERADIEVDLMSDLSAAERAALHRFERAKSAGAAERTALNLAAWAWIEQRPSDSLAVALQEVSRVVRRGTASSRELSRTH
jgi:hypothetical protein